MTHTRLPESQIAMQFPEGPKFGNCRFDNSCFFRSGPPGHPVWKTFAIDEVANSTVRVIVLIYRHACLVKLAWGSHRAQCHIYGLTSRGGGGARRRREVVSGYVVGSYSIVKVYVY